MTDAQSLFNIATAFVFMGCVGLIMVPIWLIYLLVSYFRSKSIHGE